MPTKPQVLKRSRVASSKIFHVEALQMRFANGVERDYERLLSNHQAVIICPMLDDDRVILAQEYAAGTDDYQWSLPKGKLDPGEDYTSAANRELQEEIGYAAEELILLKNMAQSPTICSTAPSWYWPASSTRKRPWVMNLSPSTPALFPCRI